MDWVDAWGTQQSCSASWHATLVSDLCANREPAPEFMEQSPRRSPVPALRSDQRSLRLTDRLQLLSLNPGPTTRFGSELAGFAPQSSVACDHCTKGAGFVTNSSLTEIFHVITQHLCVVFLNKDTFAREYSCTASQGPVLAQVLFVGHQRHGCHWQVPQSA